MEEIHYYEFGERGGILCGENANKDSNWVVNSELVTCKKCKEILETQKGML